MCDSLEAGPELGLPHPGHGFGRHAERRRHESLDRIPTTPGCRQFGQVVGEARGEQRAVLVDDERRLVDRQLGDVQAVGRGLQGQDAAGRSAHDKRRSTRIGDQRGKVLDLAIHGIGQRVSAVAATTAVVAVDGKARREYGGNGRGATSVAHRAADQD